ncbi:hypothetical protein G3M54_01600 [Bacillus megaterium NBRC 15308 = ATCC 14581]|nr:hypothetical protein [Priestia megaterium NBRC 15308 = ATCC 14581]
MRYLQKKILNISLIEFHITVGKIMKILIASTIVPYVEGGGSLIADWLK